MRVLVTGASGLVGNNIVRSLLDSGREVRVLVRASSDPRPLEGLSVERAEGDVRDEHSVRQACQGVAAVIHAAALVHIGWKRLDEQRAVNVGGTRNVATAARNAGARLVHVSTVDALGLGTLEQPASEDSPRQGNPDCGYVVTKREAEQFVREEISRGLNAVIVNPGFMLGPWDWKPSSGRMLIEVVKRRPLMAPWGGFSVCDVRDVCKGILTALERAPSGRQFILAGKNLRYVDLWRLFARVAHSRPPICRAGPLIRTVAGRIGDLWGSWSGREPDVNSAAVAMSSLYHYYDSGRAQRELDYNVRPLDTTVADTFQWFREHGYLAP